MGVLSLLFHRQARKEGRCTVSACIWFPISSHFLIVSVSASGSYFEKRLSKEEISQSLTHVVGVDADSHSTMWQMDTANTNGTHCFK